MSVTRDFITDKIWLQSFGSENSSIQLYNEPAIGIIEAVDTFIELSELNSAPVSETLSLSEDWGSIDVSVPGVLISRELFTELSQYRGTPIAETLAITRDWITDVIFVKKIESNTEVMVGGVWKASSGSFVLIDGVWRKAKIYVLHEGIWRT